jgi:hypothetical protein
MTNSDLTPDAASVRQQVLDKISDRKQSSPFDAGLDPASKIACVETILQALDYVQNRPAMYVGAPDNIAAIDTFLYGLGLGCSVLGIGFGYLRYFETIRANGYKTSADVGALYEQMRERGLSEEEIVRERIRFEIETFQALLEELKDAKQPDASD